MATHNTLLSDDSLSVRPEGLAIAIQLPWYRSIWLSSVGAITVTVDGRVIPSDVLTAELAGETYRVRELPDRWDVLWFIQDRLVVVAPLDEPPAPDQPVDVEVTMHSMSPTLLRTLSRMGLGDDDLARLQEIWAKDTGINERHGEFVEYLESRGIAPAGLGPFARLAFNMLGHVDPAEWADIMPQIVHVHAKFYDIDENGNEPAIDYPAIVRRLVAGGYSGFMSSEWEGHAFAGLDEADPIDLIARQHALIRRSIRDTLAEQPVR